MFKKIIVGIDDGEGGLDALALARLLSADDTELTLVSIYPGEPVAWRGASGLFQEALREDSERVLARAREASGVAVRTRVHVSPDVGRGLHEVAEAIDADLVVVGSSRKGYVGRVLTADDTRHALNGASCAVAVAPAGYGHAEAALRKIGVGYDRSPESECALAFARDLAQEHSATVAAMEVLYFPARYFVGPALPDRPAVAALLDQARERVRQTGRVEAHAVAGVPAEELARFSESVDLLVVGSRGYGPLGRIVYGSVGQELARSARSPLLVLPRQAGVLKGSPAEAEVASGTL